MDSTSVQATSLLKFWDSFHALQAYELKLQFNILAFLKSEQKRFEEMILQNYYNENFDFEGINAARTYVVKEIKQINPKISGLKAEVEKANLMMRKIRAVIKSANTSSQ